MSRVEVPETFAAIGFSGTFNIECTFPSPEDAAKWREKAPCLVHGDRFALISVDENDVGTLVRKDAGALMDLVTMPKVRAR